MRASSLFLATLREVPAEAELISHQLLLRAGYIRKVAAGVYCLLPLGKRVLRKIEEIVRQEMDRAGAQELTLPTLQPEELWDQSGRGAMWGPELIRLQDRNERSFVLGPTHEEVITTLVKGEISSYRQLPVTLYQIATKFRDDLRPRGGLIRAREFGMKDAYSFDRDWAGLDVSYEKMKQAYFRILERLGLPYRTIEAEAGSMGGTDTNEFMLLTETGEGVGLFCSSCDYSASDERAAMTVPEAKPLTEAPKPIEKMGTPDQKTIEQVTAFLNLPADRLVKTLIYLADDKPVAALVRGDRELGEGKLRRALGITKLEMAPPKVIAEVTKAPVGFAGPIGLSGVKIIADEELRSLANFVTGANAADAHYINVNHGRDFEINQWAQLRFAVEGDACPRCQSPLEVKRGIELAHIFKLGTYFSDALDAKFRDEDSKDQPLVMGCYGFGTTRVMAAAVEYSHDADGIIWPATIAPYHATIVVLNTSDAAQAQLGERLYAAFLEHNIETLLDDRDERPGVKFKDADLIGIPLQIIVGKRAAEDKVELRMRRDRAATVVGRDEALETAIGCAANWREGCP